MKNFVHLHVHTDYSLLDGFSSIKEIVSRVKEIGQKAVAITDHGNMFGVLEFYNECKKQDIKPLIGCEFYVSPKGRKERRSGERSNRNYHLVLIAKNLEGYKNLIILSSLAYTEGFYYRPRIDDELLEKHSNGLICLTACLAGQIPSLLLDNKINEAEDVIKKYQSFFPKDHFYIELQDHGIEEQKTVAPMLIDLSKRLDIPMVVTNDTHYAKQQDHIAHDVLLCIGTQKLRKETNRMKFHGSQFYLKDKEEMARLFPDYPEMITNTVKIANMCDFEMPLPGAILPIYETPSDFTDKESYLKWLINKGLEKRYTNLTDEIKKRADYEFSVISRMDFVGYFLIVWDFINWAKNRNISVGPGRGSGAGSIVAYALEITDIDPLKYNLLFERFLNPERNSMPDFDIDFDFEYRQEVIDYVKEKYGDEQVGQIVSFNTLKAKNAIKDVGRVLDIPLSETDAIAKLIPNTPNAKLIDLFEKNKDIPRSGLGAHLRDNEDYRELFEIAFSLEGKKRNTSLHPCGMVIGKTKLTDYVPIFKDAKSGVTATQFTMDLIEDCGLVKMDLLGLKNLTVIRHTEELIRKRGGEFSNFSIEEQSELDTTTFEMLSNGNSISVFQFESGGMQNILKKAKPDKIEDLIALVSLFRPGPMQFIDQFVESKSNPEKIKYPHPCLEPILSETYGVIVYQEQVMQVAQKIAGYCLGQADLLRRAMGKKQPEVLAKEKVPFINGAVKNGFSKELASEIFEILVPFAGYGFNKSHAAAYSIIAYRTAFLKANFPYEFFASVFTNDMHDPKKLSKIISEARKLKIQIDPPDINRSEPVFTVDKNVVVYGLLGIKGLGENAAKEIVRVRNKHGKFTSFINFLEQVNLSTVNKRALEALIQTGCFDKFDANRATLMSNLERSVDFTNKKKSALEVGQESLFADTDEKEFADFTFEEFESWSLLEKLKIEKDLIGFYISGHPLDPYKEIYEKSSNLNLDNLERVRSDKLYTLIGMLKTTKPYQTKNGSWMGFGSYEDYSGTIDLVFFPKVWKQYEEIIKEDSIVGLTGKVDTKRANPSFLVESVFIPEESNKDVIREIHIELDSNITSEKQLTDLWEFLIDSSGPCSVYLHIDDSQNEYVIKTTNQIRVSSSNDFIEELREVPTVVEVWKE